MDTLMTKMIERVALAMVRCEMVKAGICRPGGTLWNEAANHADLAVSAYGDFARAAIEAMRAELNDLAEAARKDDAAAFNEVLSRIDAELVGDR
jgi:hypothetical protein